MHFANCTTLAAVLFTISIENLRLCSSEAGIVLNLFLNFEQKGASCSYKIVLIKKCNKLSPKFLFDKFEKSTKKAMLCKVFVNF